MSTPSSEYPVDVATRTQRPRVARCEPSTTVTHRSATPEDPSSNRKLSTVFLGLLVVTFALSQSFMLVANAIPDRQHLGAEYFNIASALAAGRGFSDPFGSATGPTAWMPPLFCVFLSALIAILHSTYAVAQVVAAISNVALAAVGVVIYRVAERHLRHLSARLAVGLYVLWLFFFYSGYFMLSHDVWMMALIGGGFLLAISGYACTLRVNSLAWGALGGLSILAAPAMTLSWAILMLRMLIRERGQQQRAVVVAMAIAAVSGGPWLIRNAVTFHQFIPTKSNTWFEAYQANDIDDDGIYDASSFWQHPFNVLDARREYAQKGERRFIEERRRAFFSSVRSEPFGYLRKVRNRVLASTIIRPSQDPAGAGPVDWIRSAFFAIPALSALLSIPIRRNRFGGRPLPLLKTFYFAYLVPYWFVAFYERHLLPITAIVVILGCLGIDQAIGFIKSLLSQTVTSQTAPELATGCNRDTTTPRGSHDEALRGLEPI